MEVMMSRINNNYYAILGILNFHPMSGYHIKLTASQGVGNFWDMDYKQIYPTLKKLVTEKLATVEIVKADSRPDSKVYKLTEAGVNKFYDWLKSPLTDGKQIRTELMFKLYFGYNISAEIIISQVQNYKQIKIAELKNIEEIMGSIEAEAKKDAFWHYRVVTIDRGKKIISVEIDWCNDTIQYLSANLL